MDSIANGVFGFLQRPRVARHAKEAILVAANLDAPPMYRSGACANWRHALQYTVFRHTRLSHQTVTPDFHTSSSNRGVSGGARELLALSNWPTHSSSPCR